MKVIHVIDSLGGSGGAEHGLVREIALFSADIDQRVCRLFRKDALQAQLEALGIPVFSFGLSSSLATTNWSLATIRLVREIRRLRPDVLHSSLFTANLVAQLAGVLTATPVLSTFTLSGDRRLLREFQPGAGSWRASILRWFAGRAARSRRVWFRSLSQDALTTNVDLLGVKPERVVVIPRGVPSDLTPAHPRTRLELGLPVTGRIVLNIGRQTRQKGHRYLVEALAIVRREIDAHLVILGREGDATEAIRDAIAQLGIKDHVSLTGYTPWVADYLTHADVFAFASVMEGLGTAVIEAMAARIPVVSFDIPPVREVTDAGRAAVLVPLGDVAGLANGIVTLMDPRASERYIEAGQELVRGRHSLDVVSAKLEQRLREVADAEAP